MTEVFRNDANTVAPGMDSAQNSLPEPPRATNAVAGVEPEVTSTLDFGNEATKQEITRIIDNVVKVKGISLDAALKDQEGAEKVRDIGGPVTELSSSRGTTDGLSALYSRPTGQPMMVPMQAMAQMPMQAMSPMAQMPMQAMSTMAQMPRSVMPSSFGGSGYSSPSSAGTYSSRSGSGSGSSRRVTGRVLRQGVANERGLQRNTILAARAISAAFPEIREIGGYRQDPLHWHPNGLAIDVMIPNYDTPQGRALGDRVLKFVLENGERFGLNNAIWRQTLYEENGSASRMQNLGNPTANHMDHVHIATTGGGYPNRRQRYVL